MKIYCINLRRSTDRRTRMEAELARLPLEHEFIDAVDGRAMSPAEVSLAYSKVRTMLRHGKGLTRGELGCALSHVRFYRRFLSTTDNAAFVFEDDVSMGKGIVAALEASGSFLSNAKEPTMVQFAGNDRDDISSYAGTDRFVEPDKVVGTYAYGVNRAAAELLIREYSPVKMPIDSYRYMRRRRHLRVFRLRDRVLSVDMSCDSTIGNERFSNGMSPLGMVVWKLWRLFGVLADRCLG